jgi:Spy/CpxP family protein refolding chaperone
MTERIYLDPARSLRRGIAVFALAVAATIGGVAAAQPPVPGVMSDIALRAGRLEQRLNAVGATKEQKMRIRAIFQQAAADLASVRTQRQANRHQIRAAFAQPNIDGIQLETLRVEQMQLVDASSRRWMTALVDAAKVLTAEQRAAIAQH